MDYTKPGWYHRVDLERLTGPRVKITATAGLFMMRGNSLPYFSISITGETLTKLRGGGWHVESCGQLPGLAKDFPELAEVAPLHLSDINGVPMHAEEIGWYWLAGYLGGAGERFHGGNSTPKRDKGDCLRIFAEHMRFSIEQATSAVEFLMLWQGQVVYNRSMDKCIGVLMPGERKKWQLIKQAFARLVQNQLPRWKDEADKAIAILDKLAADQAKEGSK